MVPENTKKATYHEYLDHLSTGVPSTGWAELNLESITPKNLATVRLVLELFHADARKKNGEKYCRNSLLSARGAINRHLH